MRLCVCMCVRMRMRVCVCVRVRVFVAIGVRGEWRYVVDAMVYSNRTPSAL
jgi:hypothetical protein